MLVYRLSLVSSLVRSSPSWVARTKSLVYLIYYIATRLHIVFSSPMHDKEIVTLSTHMIIALICVDYDDGETVECKSFDPLVNLRGRS